MYKLKIDKELRELLPPLTADEYERLEQSILKNGLQDTIKIWKNKSNNEFVIVDGHNRYSICQKHNIDFTKHIYLMDDSYQTKDDIIEYMITYQLGRRNLSEYEKFEIVQKYKSHFTSKAKQNNSDGGKGLSTLTKVDTRKEMARMVGVSTGTYQKLDKIYYSGNEGIKNKVKNKEVSIDKAYKEIKPNKESEKSETTADIDKKLLKLDDEIARIKKEKEKMFLRRQKVFEDTPDDIKCEVEIVEEELSYGKCIYVNFYLVKGENKTKVINELSSFSYEKPIEKTVQQIEDDLRWFFMNHTRRTDKEKNIILAKFYETRDEVLQRIKELEENERRKREEYYQKLLDVVTNKPINPLAEEIILVGWKTLAKKYHPDVTGDDGSKMKELNQAKEQLLQRI